MTELNGEQIAQEVLNCLARIERATRGKASVSINGDTGVRIRLRRGKRRVRIKVWVSKRKEPR